MTGRCISANIDSDDGASRFSNLRPAFSLSSQSDLPRAMANAGEVFYLPPEPREPADKGARPHVVLGLPRPDIDTVTLAYASTRRNDAVFGAGHVLIDPFATRYRGTGLVRPTCVYPSRLVVWPLDEIRSRSPAGRIVDEMPEIRASLVRALGFGTGVTNEPNRTGTNRRGRVVELLPDVAAEWEVNHAAILNRAKLLPARVPADRGAAPGRQL